MVVVFLTALVVAKVGLKAPVQWGVRIGKHTKVPLKQKETYQGATETETNIPMCQRNSNKHTKVPLKQQKTY